MEEDSILREKCLSVYEANIRQNTSTELITTAYLFGYDQLVLRTNKLLRNTMYTISVNQITLNRTISQNFSEFTDILVSIQSCNHIIYMHVQLL